MNFIELYERIDKRMRELMNESKDEKEARTLAWEGYHKEIINNLKVIQNY